MRERDTHTHTDRDRENRQTDRTQTEIEREQKRELERERESKIERARQRQLGRKMATVRKARERELEGRKKEREPERDRATERTNESRAAIPCIIRTHTTYWYAQVVFSKCTDDTFAYSDFSLFNAQRLSPSRINTKAHGARPLDHKQEAGSHFQIQFKTVNSKHRPVQTDKHWL